MKKILAITAFAFAFSMNGFAQDAPAAPADSSAPKCEKKCADKCKAKGKKCCKATKCDKACKKSEAPASEEKAA